MPGEPPLVGHFITGIGLEYLGNLVRNFDKLILRVPIIKIFQIEDVYKRQPQERNEELNPYYRKIYNSLREIQVEESACLLYTSEECSA